MATGRTIILLVQGNLETSPISGMHARAIKFHASPSSYIPIQEETIRVVYRAPVRYVVLEHQLFRAMVAWWDF